MKTYRSKECKRCGGTERYKSNGICPTCQSRRANEWNKNNKEKKNKNHREWCKYNPERKKELDDNWKKTKNGKAISKASSKKYINEPGNQYHNRHPLKAWLSSARSRAKKNNIPFDIDEEDLTIPSECPILGIPLFKSEGIYTDNSPSLDKIIPELGYVKGNVVVVSRRANRIKNDGTAEEHLKIYEFITRNAHS